MRISYRQADYGQTQQPVEHLDNIGGPRVTIEPGFQSAIQEAVNFVSTQYPDLLRDVTDVYGHIEGGGMFGEYKSDSPHSIYIDINNIESEVRNQMQGQDDEAIRQQIQQQIIKTIVHEATHKKEYAATGNTSEEGPEAAERAVEPLFTPTSASYRKKIAAASGDLEARVALLEDKVEMLRTELNTIQTQ